MAQAVTITGYSNIASHASFALGDTSTNLLSANPTLLASATSVTATDAPILSLSTAYTLITLDHHASGHPFGDVAVWEAWGDPIGQGSSFGLIAQILRQAAQVIGAHEPGVPRCCSEITNLPGDAS